MLEMRSQKTHFGGKDIKRKRKEKVFFFFLENGKLRVVFYARELDAIKKRKFNA